MATVAEGGEGETVTSKNLYDKCGREILQGFVNKVKELGDSSYSKRYSEMALKSRTRQSALQAGYGYSVHGDIQFLKDFICGYRKDLDRLMLCGCNSPCNLALRAQACDRIEKQLDGQDAMVFNDQEQFGNVLEVEIYKDKPERHTIQPAA